MGPKARALRNHTLFLPYLRLPHSLHKATACFSGRRKTRCIQGQSLHTFLTFLLGRSADLNLDRVYQGAWFGKSCRSCAAVVASSKAAMFFVVVLCAFFWP